jgi:hypothetical protein
VTAGGRDRGGKNGGAVLKRKALLTMASLSPKVRIQAFMTKSGDPIRGPRKNDLRPIAMDLVMFRHSPLIFYQTLILGTEKSLAIHL